LQNATHVPHHIVVPEPKYVETLCPQPLIARNVMARTVVLSTIQLDDQSLLRTNKVDHVDAQRNLSAKSVAELLRAQVPP
jgi:hypothetical protein